MEKKDRLLLSQPRDFKEEGGECPLCCRKGLEVSTNMMFFVLSAA